MSQQVTITSVTANTPVEIYYCDSLSASCVYVATVSTFPYFFDVPVPYCNQDFVVSIIDTNNCEIGYEIYITPTPTPSITASPTMTPSHTATPTQTVTNTPSFSPSPTTTITATPTHSPTPSVTPVVAGHLVGQGVFTSSANTCPDVITSTSYYTYINQANTVPVLGVTVYMTNVNGVLYNPYDGNSKWILMVWGSTYYAVQINDLGQITSFGICY